MLFKHCECSFGPEFSNYALVLYRYVFGVTHIPRLEDWPVMPVERIGFMLMVFQ